MVRATPADVHGAVRDGATPVDTRSLDAQEYRSMWRKIEAEGCLWEVRAISLEGDGEDVLEFRPLVPTRPPRRLAVSTDALDSMSDEDLQAAFVQARPIGGDFYGRPGKRMTDT